MRLNDALATDERLEEFCQMLADGTPKRVIGETFGCTRESVHNWMKDARVQARWDRIIKERSRNIRSQTDNRILKRLEQGDNLTLDQLLRVRQTFAGEAPESSDAAGAGEALADLMRAAARDPELAKRLAGASSS